MNSEEGSAFLLGLVVAAVIAFVAFQVSESRCQESYDVADCEWSRSPFTPAARPTTPGTGDGE
jgi:hypothetical protein